MDNYIFSKNTIEFVTVGVEFCALMEKVQESEKRIYRYHRKDSSFALSQSDIASGLK